MPRLLRFIPEGGALVEITTRTLQGRLLLTPKPLLNRIIIGALARASQRFQVGIVAAVVLSNHYHILARVDDAEQLSAFLALFNSKLAREVGRLTGWKEKVWSRRYQAIVISSEEGAQVERLRYVLSHGCKEGLVARLTEWPGVHSGPALLSGTPLEGVWHDRTREYLARMKGEEIRQEEFVQPETLTFQFLPCWSHLSSEAYRSRISGLAEEIEAEAAGVRERSGSQPLGAEAIRQQNPTTQPNRIKKSPAPRFHAFTKRARKELYQAYSWFAATFREAAEKLLQGDRDARFPQGSFPPHLPFVREAPPPPLPQPV